MPGGGTGPVAGTGPVVGQVLTGGTINEGGVAPSNNSGSTSNTTVTTTGGGGGTTSTVNPQAQAYYNDIISQLQSQLSTAQGEQPTLIDNINNAANDQLNQLNQQESNAESGYNTQNAQNGSSRATNIDQINQGANGLYNSLMAILGSSGAGVSSAARYGAPQDVSLNASGQRAGADTTYNNNASSIATDENATKQQYGDAVNDLNSQKQTDIGTALQSLLNSEASINQQITQAQTDANTYTGETFTPAQQQGPVNAVSSIESQLGQIFNQYATPTFNVSPVTATTPNLTTFNVDPTTIKAQTNSPGSEAAFAPYLQSLNNNDNVLTGGQPATAPTTAQGATAGVAA